MSIKIEIDKSIININRNNSNILPNIINNNII